jgi:acyl-homoserine lactone acylase PvdQ
VNPDKGYLVSANNFVTSQNSKHGISHAFTFNHRSIRISEMLDSFKQNNKKISLVDMSKMQMDVLDVQARDSLEDMLTCVDKAMHLMSEID